MSNIDLREMFKGCPGYELFSRPRAGRNVWPHQACPRFSPRSYSLFGADMETACWFCRYADFHLDWAVALDVGICCYPEEEGWK